MNISNCLASIKLLLQNRRRQLFLLGGLPILIAACAEAPVLPQRPSASSAALAFDAAIDFAVDDILIQAQRLPEFQPAKKSTVEALLQREASVAPRSKIMVDLALDSISGQQTLGTRLLDERLLARAKSRFPQFEVLPLIDSIKSNSGLASGNFLIASSLTRLGTQVTSVDTRYRINLSLTDLRTGYILAQSAAQTTAVGINVTPTRFYQDSPSIKRDRIVDGQIKTSQANVGAEADGVYVSSLETSSLVAEGSKLYDAGQAEAALRMYEIAALRPDGKQLRTFNGLYLTNMQLGRTEAAERAFFHIVSLGLETNSLAIKFLFKPGATDFLTDQGVSAPYPMWLRVLGTQIANSRKCLSIVGHSSKTGAELFNERLSYARALSIQKRLEAATPPTAGYLQSVGMGYRENVIGTGADDLSDAMDRRVEFRTRDCSPGVNK